MPGNRRGASTFLKPLTRGDKPYVGALILLNLFFFGNALFTVNTFFYRDISNFHHPLKKLVTEAYSHGEWPLWNPYAQFGQPLLANPNAMALCPTQLLFHLLPFNWAFDLGLVLHCLIGGIGVFYLARGLAFSPVAALVAAIGYNFSGVVLSFVNLPNLAPLTGLFPWLAFLLKRTIDRPSSSVVAWFSLAVALFCLSVEPLTGAAILLFLVPLGVYSFLKRPDGRSPLRIGAALSVVLFSGLSLAAVQILPTLELLWNSARQAGLTFGSATFWSVHPIALTQMLFPTVWMDTFTLNTLSAFWSDVFFESREAYILSGYCGLSCLLLALLGLLFSERRALKWVLAAVTLAALLLALGKYTPLYSVLYDYLPPFRFGRYPAKYLLAVALCLALSAGLGIDGLPRLRICLQSAKGKKLFASYLFLVAGLLAVSGVLGTTWFWSKAGARVGDNLIQLNYRETRFAISLPLLRQSVLYLWLVVLAGTGLILFSIKARFRVIACITALTVLLVFFDLLINRSVNPIVHSDLYARSPVAEWLLDREAKEGPFRVYHWPAIGPQYQILGKSNTLAWYYVLRRLAAMPYTAAGDHIQYSSFFTIDRLDTSASQRLHSDINQTKTPEDRLNYLAGLNVRYVISMEPLESRQLDLQASFSVNSDQLLRIYRLGSALPRAYLTDSGDEVRVTRYRPGEVDLAFRASKAGTLVLLDSYYPGWRAWVDAEEVRIEIVNGAFRGVLVQPGEHKVRFLYDPASFRYGFTLTLSTLIAWAGALVLLHRRRTAGKPD